MVLVNLRVSVMVGSGSSSAVGVRSTSIVFEVVEAPKRIEFRRKRSRILSRAKTISEVKY